MKKYLKKIICAVAVGAFSLTLTGCDLNKLITTDTPISAYEIAKEHGFQGTEAQWLESLKGTDGKDSTITVTDIYEEWVKQDGNTGKTFNEFLKEYLSVSATADNDTDTVANAMRSVVSVQCAFDTTQSVTVGFSWNTSPKTVKYKTVSAGSGVVWKANETTGEAYIITNFHVVYDENATDENGISDEIFLYSYGVKNTFNYLATTTVNGKVCPTQVDGGEQALKADFLYGSPTYDIAVLKVQGSTLLKESLQSGAVTTAKIGNSDTVQLGQKTYAIGNPGGYGVAVSSGVVSVDSESITLANIVDSSLADVEHRVIRTDAPINPGNSGGGLFDAQGNLIGITNAKCVQDDVEGEGYAIPINEAMAVIGNLQDNGTLKKAQLGITVQTKSSKAVYDSVTGRSKLIETLVVVSVNGNAKNGSTVAYGKMEENDVLYSVEFGGKTTVIERFFHLSDVLLQVRKGDTVKITVLRSGTPTTLTFEFSEDGYFVAVD